MIVVRLQETEHFLFVTPEKFSKDDIPILTTWKVNLNPEVLPLDQGGRSCATARPPVSASAGAPSIRAFVAKSVLSQFTRFWMYSFQPFMVIS